MAITTFVANQILTAAQMNAVQSNDFNQTVSTKTASYTLVAADKGTRIVMNVTGASTVTVNTSLFSAGDTLTIQNISATACTLTAGTATVSSAGPLAIPQNGSGLLYFTSAGVSIFYPTAVTASAGALVRVGGGALSSTTTTFSNVFSATYRNYLITGDGITTSSTTIRMTIGAAAANYNYGYNRVTFAGAVSGSGASSQTDGIVWFDSATTTPGGGQMFIFSPFETARTTMTFQAANNTATPFIASGGGILQDNTSYTAFTLASGSNMAGTINVYGIAPS